MTDEQITAGYGGVEEPLYKGILCLLVKINHYVTAKYYVKFQSKTDGIHQIKCPENYVIFQHISYLIDTGFIRAFEVFLLP